METALHVLVGALVDILRIFMWPWCIAYCIHTIFSGKSGPFIVTNKTVHKQGMNSTLNYPEKQK